MNSAEESANRPNRWCKQKIEHAFAKNDEAKKLCQLSQAMVLKYFA